MHQPTRSLTAVLFAITTFTGLCIAIANDPAATGWLTADIGAPESAGTHTFADGILKITGAGKGDGSEADQLHYVYREFPAGDVELVARLASLSTEPRARAGLMLRADNSPAATMAMIAYSVQDVSGNRNGFHNRGRDLSAPAGRQASGGHTGIQPPLWLKICRVGNDFGVYKSPDGKLWSQVQNQSGGAFTVAGPFHVGFFVSSGDAARTASATFDQIYLGKPRLAYRSSWIGSSINQNSTGHVTGALSALHVEPDGRCYTNTYFDEAGQALKLYQNGRVIQGFHGNNECLGGSVTSDGKQLYLARGHGVYTAEMIGNSNIDRQLFFASDLRDRKNNVNAVCGMAVIGGELFIGHTLENRVLVANPEFKPLYTAGNTSTNFATEAIDTRGVAHAAPPAVYQSQRETDYTPYLVPGLNPKTAYTARFHFAEYKEDQPGKRLINIGAGGQQVRGYDVVAAAGGKNKPAVVDLPNAMSDATGTMHIVLERAEGGNGHIVICGIELLGADGAPAFRLNCGGAAVGSFQSDVHELAERGFAFDRPGPMIADKRGELWIIQRANDASQLHLCTTRYPGAIRCYRTDGTFTGREITDVVNPTAIAYDAATDRLLIAENGPDQNIRIYGGLDKRPAHVGSFGVAGGIYAGKTPGKLVDPDAGGQARLYAPIGVGIDVEGNIYTACHGAGTDLRKYKANGELVWKLGAHHFVDCGDFDPDSDGTEVYTPYKHYTMDYSRTDPGSEWSFTAYNWNPARYGEAPRPNCASAVVRRLGDDRRLILYTSGQGTAGHVGIFRFDGEIAVPCGRLEADGKQQIWIDSNGDGKQTDDECKPHPNGGFVSFAVDRRGDIWTVAGRDTFYLRHYPLRGFNEHGVPLYSAEEGDVEQIQFPIDAGKYRSWGQVGRVSYDSDRDVMYLIGPRSNRNPDGKDNPRNYLARYDNWSSGNRTAKWIVNLPDPDDEPNFMYAPPYPYNLPFHWMAFDVAEDKIFVAELWGPVHVYDAATGVRDTILVPGPEVSGSNAWEDEQMGIRACKRKNGEYLILTENSGYYGKNNLFRWKP